MNKRVVSIQNKITKTTIMGDDYIEVKYVDSETQSISQKTHDKTSKVTDGVSTQYEYSRLLSAMAKLLAAGYPPQVEWDGPFDPIAIAKKQIEQRVGTLVIVRRIPDLSKPGGFREEIWDLKNMDIRDS